MSLIAKCRTTKKLAIISSLLMLAGIVTIIGCEHDVSLTRNYDTAYRIIAWNYLSERERAIVSGDLNSARVKPATWQGKDVVSVTFNTAEDAILGPIVIYIDPQTKKVVERTAFGDNSFPKGTYTIVVYHVKHPCIGLFPRECLLARRKENEGWSLFGNRIEGFESTEGFTYELLVQVDEIENPLQDSSALKFTLLELISRERVN